MKQYPVIEVFKTNIAAYREFLAVATAIKQCFPEAGVSFDPDDLDCIVRVESPALNAERVISIIRGQGYVCEILPD